MKKKTHIGKNYMQFLEYVWKFIFFPLHFSQFFPFFPLPIMLQCHSIWQVIHSKNILINDKKNKFTIMINKFGHWSIFSWFLLSFFPNLFSFLILGIFLLFSLCALPALDLLSPTSPSSYSPLFPFSPLLPLT